MSTSGMLLCCREVVAFAVMVCLVQEEVLANQRDMVTLLLGTGSMQRNAALEKALGQK